MVKQASAKHKQKLPTRQLSPCSAINSLYIFYHSRLLLELDTQIDRLTVPPVSVEASCEFFYPTNSRHRHVHETRIIRRRSEKTNQLATPLSHFMNCSPLTGRRACHRSRYLRSSLFSLPETIPTYALVYNVTVMTCLTAESPEHSPTSAYADQAVSTSIGISSTPSNPGPPFCPTCANMISVPQPPQVDDDKPKPVSITSAVPF